MGNKTTINGYIVEKINDNSYRVEGKGCMSKREAEDCLGIYSAKRQWESLRDKLDFL